VLSEVEEGGLGDLRHWFSRRYKLHAGVSWGDRTIGDLLEEAFLGLAQELVELRTAWDPASPEAAEVAARVSELEEVFRENKPKVYVEGATGDPWIDDWMQDQNVQDGEQDEPEGEQDEDDWEDYSYKAG